MLEHKDSAVSHSLTSAMQDINAVIHLMHHGQAVCETRAQLERVGMFLDCRR